MAMVVVIGWQVYDVARTDYGMSPREAAFQLGLLGAVQFVPLALLTPVAGWIADRFERRLVARVANGIDLVIALALGLGMGAVFKLVPVWYPDRVGAVTGIVAAAGGLGGFFPPLVMGVVKSATGGYALGFVLMAAVALGCLVVLRALGGAEPAPAPA